jgi:hypothetical protein
MRYRDRLPPIMVARELHAPPWLFLYFLVKFKGISVFSPYNDTQVIFGTFRSILCLFIHVFIIFFVFCKIPEINIKKNDDVGPTPKLSRHHASV